MYYIHIVLIPDFPKVETRSKFIEYCVSIQISVLLRYNIFIIKVFSGHGHLSGCVADNLITNHDIRGRPLTRKGDVYMDLQSYTIKMRTKRLHLNFKNLFNGDKTLGKSFVGAVHLQIRPDSTFITGSSCNYVYGAKLYLMT